MNFSFEHDFDIDVPSYWKLFLSEEFNVDLYKELRMKNREVVKQEDDGKLFHRIVKFEPTTPIPAFLQSVVKSTGYTEIDHLTWERNVMRVKIETAMFKDRFHMEGDYVVAPLDGGKRCRRTFKGEAKVSMPLIGGRIEKYMMEQMRDSYEIAARVTRKWIEKQKASKPAT
jgi:hypothetical protein